MNNQAEPSRNINQWVYYLRKLSAGAGKIQKVKDQGKLIHTGFSKLTLVLS